MATLAAIRAALNLEVGVAAADDATDPVFPMAARNAAIGAGYGALWSAGVRRPVLVDVASSSTTDYYAVSGIASLGYLEVLDSSLLVVDRPAAEIVDDGAGGYQLRTVPLADGFTLRLHGWTPYLSTFATDAALDDLPAALGRVPLLKAKAILYGGSQTALLARYQVRQGITPEMSLTVDQLLAIRAAAEREWQQVTSQLSHGRPRFTRARQVAW